MRASKRIHSTPSVQTMSKTLFKNEIGATKHTFSKPFYIVKKPNSKMNLGQHMLKSSLLRFCFSKVLCLLMHRLISTKSSGEIKTSFYLTCCLFCDIVFLFKPHQLITKTVHCKHEKIIQLFYNLREKYAHNTCQNN